jgi:hypothetical protein
METIDLLKAIQEIERRAERVYDDAHVVETYVDSGGLASALSATDNGIVSGRRGTGKTHALRYLAERQRKHGDFVVYIDVEQDLGSTEGLYADPQLPTSERATRLLVDVLGMIHEALLTEAFEGRGNIDLLEKVLDHFGEVVVAEEVEIVSGLDTETERGSSAGVAAEFGQSGPRVSGTLASSGSEKRSERDQQTVRGKQRLRVHFGAVANFMSQATEAHPARRCWVLFDEWSSLPRDLQPFLAQMLRRLFFSLPKVTVRVGTIPHRTEWRVGTEAGSYIGLEAGAEIFPLLDLDEFVVFPARNRHVQTHRSTIFFKTLLFRHLNKILRDTGRDQLGSPDEMVSVLFTQVTALQELVRAAEGVPRDALTIIARAALRAGDTKISTDHIRAAAAEVYMTTKNALLNGVPEARKLLEIIIGEVISKKKARAFLLHQDASSHPLIQRLIDDRILHLIKKGYSNKDDPGARFDVLQIDYGCYVQLLKTKSAPQAMLGEGSDDSLMGAFYEDADVPEDDYRAIRNAVLDLPSALKAAEEDLAYAAVASPSN